MDAWTGGNTVNHTTSPGSHFSKPGERGILLASVIAKLSQNNKVRIIDGRSSSIKFALHRIEELPMRASARLDTKKPNEQTSSPSS